MFRIRKEIKFILIIFIILFSILLGIKKSNLDKMFVQDVVEIDMSKAKDIFENSLNNNKIRFDYHVEDLSEINSLLAEVNEIENTNILYSEIKSKYNLIVFEVSAGISNKILTKLRSITGICNENIQRSGIITGNTDLKENLNNNQIAKIRIQNLINDSVSPDRIERFRSQLDVIQAKIDSLSIQKDIQKHNAEFNIIMISAINNINGNTALRRNVNVFFLTTFVSLLLLIIGFIIIFYIFVLMNKLLLTLGIRTSRGSNSSYNYHSRGYGRKTKRIYKDKDGNVIKKDK